MFKTLQKALVTAGDYLFPNFTCLVCRDELNTPQNPHICEVCTAELPVNTEPITLRDTKQDQHFNEAYAAFKYEDPIVGLVLRLKYNAEKDIAEALAPFLAGMFVQEKLAADVIVPVPLSQKRHKERSYNQAFLVAQFVAEYIKTPIAPDALVRIKATEAQKKMTVEQRAENLKNAFAIQNAEAIKGKRVLLIDDVFTSGSTVNECARVLRSAGAGDVNVLTIASVFV